MRSRSPLAINISNLRSIHFAGIGGLAMVAMVGVTAMAIPLALCLLVGSALAGALAAAVVIRRRRDHVLGTPDGGMPMSLGLSDTGGRPLVEPLTADDARRGAPRLAVCY
jgi:hypothetical protein